MDSTYLNKSEEQITPDQFLQQELKEYFDHTRKLLDRELNDPNSKMQVQDYERILQTSNQRVFKMIKEFKDVTDIRYSKPKVFSQKINEMRQKVVPDAQGPKHLTDDHILKLWVRDTVNNVVEKFQKSVDLTKRRLRQQVNFISAMPNELKDVVVQRFEDGKRKVLTKVIDNIDKQNRKIEKKVEKIPSRQEYKAKHESKPMGKSPLDQRPNIMRHGIKM